MQKGQALVCSKAGTASIATIYHRELATRDYGRWKWRMTMIKSVESLSVVAGTAVVSAHAHGPYEYTCTLAHYTSNMQGIVPTIASTTLQIQSELAYGHLGIVNAYEVLLTPAYVAIVLEYCAEGTMLQYLEGRVTRAQTVGLYMSEDEARFFFWV